MHDPLQSHDARYHIISYHIISNSNMHIHLTEIPFVLTLFTSLMTSFLKACFADVYSTWLGSIRRRLPHTTQTQAPISPFCLWGPQKNADFLNNALWSESCALWLKIFDIGLKVPSFLLFSNFHCLLQTQYGVIRKAGFWNNRKKRGFWNSWRKCPKRVVPV